MSDFWLPEPRLRNERDERHPESGRGRRPASSGRGQQRPPPHRRPTRPESPWTKDEGAMPASGEELQNKCLVGSSASRRVSPIHAAFGPIGATLIAGRETRPWGPRQVSGGAALVGLESPITCARRLRSELPAPAVHPNRAITPVRRVIEREIRAEVGQSPGRLRQHCSRTSASQAGRDPRVKDAPGRRSGVGQGRGPSVLPESPVRTNRVAAERFVLIAVSFAPPGLADYNMEFPRNGADRYALDTRALDP